MARRRKAKTASARKRPQRNPAQLIALGALVVGAILIVALVAYAQLNRNAPIPVDADEEMLALGEQVYQTTCAACHGENGEGYGIPQAPALNETEHAWHHPDGQIQDLIKNGGKVMPALGDQLTDEEIVAVIRYIQTWWTPEQLRQQQARSLQYPLQQ
jgi:mono/diheme cytochrome c family protein